MNTVACYKVVPDVQDLDAYGTGGLNFEKAASVLGEYDLVAIEEAVQIAESTGGETALLSVGDTRLDDSKLVKAALSRGASELYRVMDEKLANADSFQNATLIASALKHIDFDVVVFGEGSSSQYSQQVGIISAALAEIPVVNSVKKVDVDGNNLIITRDTEEAQEIVRISTPCAICMTSDAVLPRVPQLRDILSAGKKPVIDISIDQLGGMCESRITTLETKIPETIVRKCVVYDSVNEETIKLLANDIKASL